MARDKKLKLSEGELKYILREAIVIHEKRKQLRSIISEQITSMEVSRARIQSLLSEGPLSNVFAGIKSAGQAVGRGVAQTVSNGVQAGKQASQANALMAPVVKAQKNVDTARQKFNQQTLKTAELVNHYHDAVVQYVQMASQASSQLQGSPQVEKVRAGLQQAVGQLQYDLESERSQIDTLLQTLGKNVGSKFAAKAGQSVQGSRDTEFTAAPSSAHSRPGTGRLPRASAKPKG